MGFVGIKKIVWALPVLLIIFLVVPQIYIYNMSQDQETAALTNIGEFLPAKHGRHHRHLDVRNFSFLGIKTKTTVRPKLYRKSRRPRRRVAVHKSVLKRGQGQGFIKALETFPWDDFASAVENREDDVLITLTPELISRIFPYLIKEPFVPVNMSCKAKPLRTQNEIKCETGTLSAPRKIAFLMQLGFDVDVLEIHLHELFDVVDKIFITEATYTHSRSLLKPLVWERVKYQQRFAKFLPKVVHFIVDDAYNTGMRNSNLSIADFDAEWTQERLRWTKFLQWNNATKYFEDTDLLGFGDSDEIASREAINYLKHCVLESDPIDVGIWFPFGAIDQAYMPDFPVDHFYHPFTLGDPTFWSLKNAKDFQNVTNYTMEYPTRKRGMSKAHVLGGMHMTNYRYLPFLLLKRLVSTEGSYNDSQQVAEFPQRAENLTFSNLQRAYAEENDERVSRRIFKLGKIQSTFELRFGFGFLPFNLEIENSTTVVLPWFYDCNRQRYPSWERGYDTRLDLILINN